MKHATTTLMPDDPRHGSSVAYRYHGCRCDKCKEQAAARQKDYLARPGVKAQRRAAQRATLQDATARQKRSASHGKWAKKNPQYQRLRAWRTQGINMQLWSWQQYLDMLQAQGCACPGCHCGLVSHKLMAQAGCVVAYVDHDHKTGRVRRLLCRDCNTALGGAKDNPAILRRLASMQEQYDRSQHHGT